MGLFYSQDMDGDVEVCAFVNNSDPSVQTCGCNCDSRVSFPFDIKIHPNNSGSNGIFLMDIQQNVVIVTTLLFLPRHHLL